MTKRLVTLGLLASLTLLAACGSKTPLEQVVDQISEAAGESAISASGGGGSQGASTAKVPAGFPLQILPGAKITEGITFTLGDVTNYTVEFEVQMPVAEVYEFYGEEIRKHGIEEMLNFLTDDGEEESGSYMGGNDTNSVIFSATKRHDEELTHVYINWSVPKQ